MTPALADPDLAHARLGSSRNHPWLRRGGWHRINAEETGGADKRARTDATRRQPGQVTPLTIHARIVNPSGRFAYPGNRAG